ncbi:hypothetical protein [Fusobacterium sp. PH5-44]|uniref:hypothetical protein n=1 Tax=unclassified Fusobacterium TaxID=2648384 RepID=UPI003D25B202
MKTNQNMDNKNEKSFIDYIIELITKILQVIFNLFTDFITDFIKHCMNEYKKLKDEGVFERMNRKDGK